jgi:RNA polymerase sigma factor (TIGR02999 family)
MNVADEFGPRLYDELRAMARRYLVRERPDHSLQPTELVHEAFLRLDRARDLQCNGKTHFLALAATQMRRILVEHARALAREKRGGRPRRVTIPENLCDKPRLLLDVIAVDQALQSLESKNSRQSQVAEMRLFAGLGVAEIAAHFGVSDRTIKKDWRVARAWLLDALGRSA